MPAFVHDVKAQNGQAEPQQHRPHQLPPNGQRHKKQSSIKSYRKKDLYGAFYVKFKVAGSLNLAGRKIVIYFESNDCKKRIAFS